MKTKIAITLSALGCIAIGYGICKAQDEPPKDTFTFEVMRVSENAIPDAQMSKEKAVFDKIASDETLTAKAREGIIDAYQAGLIESNNKQAKQQATLEAQVNLQLLITAQNQQIISILHKQAESKK